MSEMYKTYGAKTYDSLLADPAGADDIAVPCKPGCGQISAGTVMYREQSGLWTPAAAEQAADANQLCVLAESIDTDANAAVAENGRAYRAGKLLRGKVTLAEGAALTDAAVLALRKQGIVLDPLAGGEAFKNTVEG